MYFGIEKVCKCTFSSLNIHRNETISVINLLSFLSVTHHCEYVRCLRGNNYDCTFITLGDTAQSDKNCLHITI
jgi:hypothetical protein